MSNAVAQWDAVSVTCGADEVEIVSALLFAHACLGTEERESSDGGAELIGYFEHGCGASIVEALGSELGALAADATLQRQPSLRPLTIAAGDWSERWKEHYGATRISGRLVVCPSWESYVPEDGDIVVRIDPGMAFGAGNHPTTQMCLAALEEMLTAHRGRCSVLDVGTGSGILAIAAGLLGADRVVGVDVDPLAVSIARENVRRHSLEGVVQIRRGAALGTAGRWDIVVANLHTHVLLELAEVLTERTEPVGGRLVLSGLTGAGAAQVVPCFAALGWTLVREDRRADDTQGPDPWAMVILRR
ncbi:MAG: 50S ribosomal protein L11 methyltransferase [Candidatus Schekmanbacteria bacterium]|nr:50S ribosomal protein L11 methyltransferase [Candidatus Schekmanbacteria bacterium]